MLIDVRGKADPQARISSQRTCIWNGVHGVLGCPNSDCAHIHVENMGRIDRISDLLDGDF